MYLVIFLILLSLTLYELFFTKINIKIFKLFFILLTLFLALRYGQGSDYFNYNLIYNQSGTLTDFFSNISFFDYKDPLFQLVCSAFKTIKLPYEVLIFVISIFIMWCLYRFLDRWSNYKLFALFIIYSSYWAYFDSGIREGISIAIFLGFTINQFYEKRYIGAFISISIACLFHMSAGILFLLFFMRKSKEYNVIKIFILIIFISTFTIARVDLLILELLPSFAYSRVTPYMIDNGNVLALANRAIPFLIIMYIYFSKYYGINDRKSDYLFTICLWGFLGYCIFFNFRLISSRLLVYFRIAEIAFLTLYIKELHNNHLDIFRKKLLCEMLIMILISVNIVNYFKIINSYITQGEYMGVNIFTYQYVNVFNKEKIYSIRGDMRYID